jgi:hypothetical protein
MGLPGPQGSGSFLYTISEARAFGVNYLIEPRVLYVASGWPGDHGVGVGRGGDGAKNATRGPCGDAKGAAPDRLDEYLPSLDGNR